MKKLLLLLLALGLTTAAVAEQIFFEDYETTPADTDLIASGAWGNAYGNASEFKGVTCVEEADGNHCACMWGKAGSEYFWGAVIKFTEVSGRASDEDYKISFRVKRTSAEGNYGNGMLFQPRGSGMPETKFRSGSDCFFYETCSEPTVVSENTVPYGQWADFSIVYNATPGASVIRSFSFNGVEQTKLNYKFGNSGADKLNECYFFTAGYGDYAIYIDDFKVETVDVPVAPLLNVTGTEFYKFDFVGQFSHEAKVTGADATVDAEIVCYGPSDSWLSFEDGSFAKTLDLKVGEPQTLAFKADLDPMVPCVAKAKVIYTYNDGEEDVTISRLVFVQNGCDNKGYMLLQENFEGLDPDENVKTGYPLLWSDSDDNGGFGAEDPAGGENICLNVKGTQIRGAVNMPSNVYPDFDIKYSLKIFAQKGWGCYICATDGNTTEQYCEIDSNGNFVFSPFVGSEGEVSVPDCADKWIDVAYAFSIGNKDAGRPHVLKYLIVNGQTFNIDVEKESSGNDGFFKYFRTYNWSPVYFDDVEVSLVPAGQIPEPAILGLLALVGLVIARKRA